MSEEKNENANEIEKLIYQDPRARDAHGSMITAWYVGLVLGAVSFIGLAVTKLL